MVELKYTMLRIDMETWKKLKLRAVENETTLTRLVNAALKEYLLKGKPKK